MAPYAPKEFPQKHGWKIGGISLDAHETELRTNGPPPPNYLVERLERGGGGPKHYSISYTELSTSSQTSKRAPHPFSVEGLQKTPTPKITKEFDLNRPDYRGVFHVPITYKAGPGIKWQFSGSPAGALAAALAARGVKCRYGDITKVVTEADVKATFASISAKETQVSDNYTLYHPADRNSLVFPDGANIAIVARAYKHSLILFCPFMNADRTGYNHFYNTQNRPPIYARWSTGRQALLSPVVLGCLPKFKLAKNPTYEFMHVCIDTLWIIARTFFNDDLEKNEEDDEEPKRQQAVAMTIQEQIELINTVLPNVYANDKPVYENMLVQLYQRLSNEQRQSEADAEAPGKRVRQAGCPKPKRRKMIKIFEDEKEDDDNYKMSGVVSVAPPTSPKGKENEGRTTPKRETT